VPIAACRLRRTMFYMVETQLELYHGYSVSASSPLGLHDTMTVSAYADLCLACREPIAKKCDAVIGGGEPAT